MTQIKLSKTMEIPQGGEELDREPILDKHERYLRTLILNGFTPIYIADRVRVSDRCAGNSKNPNEIKVGEVTGLECGLQGAFHIHYLIYYVRTDDGQDFQTYYYALDRTHQPGGNKLLEKILRETNTEFEANYNPAPSEKHDSF